MTKRQASQYQMLARVRTFGDAHTGRFPAASEARKAFQVVSEVLERLDMFDRTRRQIRLVGVSDRDAAKRSLWTQLGAIARTARVVAKSRTGADLRFPLPLRKSDLDILQAGRLFLEQSGSLEDALLFCGLPEGFVDDLRQAVAAFEETVSGWHTRKTAAYVSHKGTHEELRRGIDAVLSLDVLVANALGRDVHAMNAWKRERHVVWPTVATAPGASVAAIDEGAAEGM